MVGRGDPCDRTRGKRVISAAHKWSDVVMREFRRPSLESFAPASGLFESRGAFTLIRHHVAGIFDSGVIQRFAEPLDHGFLSGLAGPPGRAGLFAADPG